MNIVQKAVQNLEPQTQTELARVTGQFPQAITRWINTGLVPPKHCIAIEEATKGKVTRYDLRPDVFGSEPSRFDTAA